MLNEFNAFLRKHGVLGLAVAVVIGGAVSKLVTAIVADLIMPVIGAVTPSGNWRAWVVQIGQVKLGMGDFLGALLDFLIIALVVFFLVRGVTKADEEKKA